jgi:MoxR-like ATPase
LKNDKYVRKTDGYLPKADIAFLDEIWKSSPAILNTLLTIINERVFRNGTTEEKVPLKALIAASNETPPENQGLDALYDRFIVRLLVAPMKERKNFEEFLSLSHADMNAADTESLAFSNDEWGRHLKEVSKVEIPKEVLNVIHAIKEGLIRYNKNNEKKAIYVSDRRWLKIANLLKTAAYFCERKTVLTVDTLLLRHCLWTREDNREDVEKIVEDCIKEFGIPDKTEMEKWEQEHQNLEKEVDSDFFHVKDIYDTEEINGEQCIGFNFDTPSGQWGVSQGKIRLYAKQVVPGTNNENYAIQEDGSVEKRVRCSFQGNQISVLVDTRILRDGWTRDHRSSQYKEHDKISIPIKFKKGSMKDVTPKVRKTYKDAAENSLKDICELISASERFRQQQRENNTTPFIPEEKREIVLTPLNAHIEELENHKLNAEHLIEKIEKHANTK